MPVGAIARRLPPASLPGRRHRSVQPGGLPAFAGDFDHVDMFRNVVSHQSGNGNTLSDAGAFFSISAHTLGATD